MPGAIRRYGEPGLDNVRLLRRGTVCSDKEVARFTLRADNFTQVRLAYGEEAAALALDELAGRVNRLLRGSGSATPELDGRVDCRLSSLAAMEDAASADACRSWLWSLCAAMSCLPVEAGEGSVLLLLSGAWDLPPPSVAPEELRGIAPWQHETVAGDADRAPGSRAERYRADMALAADLMSAISPDAAARPDADRLLLLWQPVRDAREPEDSLYYEALLRVVDRDGERLSPQSTLGAFERLGLSRVLDHHIVSRVLTELELDPDVRLGVNISAYSARRDPWWDDVARRLRAMPSVARRLTIEITETAALPDISAAVRFVTCMKRLGCHIALDDFGAGYASIRHLLALAPDVVKIDRAFLQRATLDDRGRGVFTHLAGLAASLAPTVIAEGVETEDQAALCRSLGIDWQQGYLWGRPSAGRVWRVAGDWRSAAVLARPNAAHFSVAPPAMLPGASPVSAAFIGPAGAGA